MKKLFIIVVCLMSVGCLSDKKAQVEIDNLQERIDELELRVRENEGRLYRQLEEKVMPQPEPAEVLPAEPAASEPVPVGVDEDRLDQPPQEDSPADADRAGQEFEQMQTMDAPPPVEKPQPNNAAPVTALSSADVKAMYQSGYTSHTKRQFEDAEAAFRTIIDNHPGHSLAPNAMYWLAEGSYSRYNYEHAKLLFQRVFDNYPDSGKAPDALYKLAMSHEKLGMTMQARETYKKLVERYPESRAAGMAKGRY